MTQRVQKKTVRTYFRIKLIFQNLQTVYFTLVLVCVLVCVCFFVGVGLGDGGGGGGILLDL